MSFNTALKPLFYFIPLLHRESNGTTFHNYSIGSKDVETNQCVATSEHVEFGMFGTVAS